jgi:hypothetical protein
MGGGLRGRVERSSTFKTLTNAPGKVIDIVSKNADYRCPMSRINFLDTKATSTYLVCRRWLKREPLARPPFNSDFAEPPITLPDP